jgi:hypothetical protein
VAHAATRHLRGTPRGSVRAAWQPDPGSRAAQGASQAAHPCLTGVGWSLARSLRGYAAWGLELGTGGALATATLALLGQALGSGGGGADETGAALLWLAIGTAAVLIIRMRDPLRRARSWGEALADFRHAVRRHAVACAVAVPVLALGTFDEATVAAPQVAQQLLQLLPWLVSMNVAGLASAMLLLPAVHGFLGAVRRVAGRRAREGGEDAPEGRAGWSDPRRRPAATRTLVAALTPPLTLILCVPAISVLASRGFAPASLLLVVGVVLGLSGLTMVAVRRGRRVTYLRPGWLAVGAGIVAGASSGAGLDLIAAGGLLGAAVGAGMEVGLHLARSVDVLWRHRHHLPLPPGDVVYRVDGREMEITLESTGTAAEGGVLPRAEEVEVTADGWRVSQLSRSCWEGTKGRAQLLGRRRADLLGVIRVLHPEAPGSPQP